jgi:ABC-type multidrug transport system fused ATPase/permease subunit
MGIVTTIRYSSTQFLQEYLSIDMKTDIYQKFMRNDVYFFEQYKSGELVSRLGTDINQAKSAVSTNLTFLIRNIFTIVANIIIIFVMSWKLSLAVTTIIPF